MIGLASRWVWDVDFAAQAAALVRASLQRAAPALVKPYAEWLSEDYLIFHVREIPGSPTVTELIQHSGSRIAQVVRGDTGQLAESEVQRGASVAHLILRKRFGSHRMERFFSL